jgi:hypothetical protein
MGAMLGRIVSDTRAWSKSVASARPSLKSPDPA